MRDNRVKYYVIELHSIDLCRNLDECINHWLKCYYLWETEQIHRVKYAWFDDVKGFSLVDWKQ